MNILAHSKSKQLSIENIIKVSLILIPGRSRILRFKCVEKGKEIIHWWYEEWKISVKKHNRGGIQNKLHGNEMYINVLTSYQDVIDPP